MVLSLAIAFMGGFCREFYCKPTSAFGVPIMLSSVLAALYTLELYGNDVSSWIDMPLWMMLKTVAIVFASLMVGGLAGICAQQLMKSSKV